MNLIEIGKFIAQLRKEHMLSQEQLGEILGVTNKTVSRWETGRYLPPAEMLLSLSDLFNVSVNELLCGKRLSSEEYKAASEDNLIQTIKSSSFTLKEKIEFYKKKWLKEHIASMCCFGMAIIAVFATGVFLKRPLISYAAVFLFVAGHAWRNNTMMAYVERKVFDDTWNNT